MEQFGRVDCQVGRKTTSNKTRQQPTKFPEGKIMSRTALCSIRLCSQPRFDRPQLLTRNRRRAKGLRASANGFAELVKWVDFHGGYVHPYLTVGESPVTGVRGVISESDLSADDVLDGPLIMIPDQLRITESTAVQKLNPLMEPLGLPSVQMLSCETQVALLLAHEKAKGQKSMWFPYIEMLPKEPPCGWMWSDEKLETFFSTLPVDKGKWLKEFAGLRKIQLQSLESDIEDALEEFGDVVRVSEQELMWCLGQVKSRAYSAGSQGAGVALNPVVDLINHSFMALPPLGMIVEDTPMTCVGTVDELPAGNELFVNYAFSPEESPLATFLEFGFVPEELLADSSKDGGKKALF
ncbi:hypothetical protein BSKO_05192 [Bryopsis sp. KO-2023]|nr:hypothetical protein BSKO_05192 [Bryopsis sp. KO-2023]